jgi:hypothetical protein
MKFIAILLLGTFMFSCKTLRQEEGLTAYSIRVAEIVSENGAISILLELKSHGGKSFYVGEDSFSLEYYKGESRLLPVSMSSLVPSPGSTEVQTPNEQLIRLEAGEHRVVRLNFEEFQTFVDEKDPTIVHTKNVLCNLLYKPYRDRFKDKEVCLQYCSIPIVSKK